MLVANCIGVVLTVTSLISIVTCNLIEPAICMILISYSIANVISTGLFAYDTSSHQCNIDDTKSPFIYFSATLSISHLMILTIAEYLILKNRPEKRAKHYTILLSIAWIMSVTVGNIVIVAIDRVVRVCFAFVMIFSAVIMISKYFMIFEKHIKQLMLLKAYEETFLDQDEAENKEKKCWDIRMLGIMLYSYVCCSMTWIINELRKGLLNDDANDLLQPISMVVYTLNFYTPAAICIYLKYKHYIAITDDGYD